MIFGGGLFPTFAQQCFIFNIDNNYSLYLQFVPTPILADP